MDKEQIFKESISNKLNDVLERLGYDKTLEHKGLVKYRNKNNTLVFVFEWNQTFGFYCQLEFGSELIDYPLQIVINRLKGLKEPKNPEFGSAFDVLLDNWTNKLSIELPELNIHELTIDSEIIQELKMEFELRNIAYNKNLELETTKRKADEAWYSQDYKEFISAVNGRVENLPSSYAKKLSIAKKRIKNKKGI
jgi:hypothetical protein